MTRKPGCNLKQPRTSKKLIIIHGELRIFPEKFDKFERPAGHIAILKCTVYLDFPIILRGPYFKTIFDYLQSYGVHKRSFKGKRRIPQHQAIHLFLFKFTPIFMNKTSHQQASTECVSDLLCSHESKIRFIYRFVLFIYIRSEATFLIEQ